MTKLPKSPRLTIYRETGEGHLKLADDILAAFFVYCLALRVEGALWEKLSSRYRWENEEIVPGNRGNRTAYSSRLIGRSRRSTVRYARNVPTSHAEIT